MSRSATRYAICFDPWYGVLSSALLLRPRDAYVDVDETGVEVRMGWAFHAEFARAAVASTARSDARPLSRGVHGLAGKWLVNGSCDNILVIDLYPVQEGRVVGVPVRLRQLLVSVEDPEDLAHALRR